MYFAALMIVASTLVLRTGERISVEGPVAERNGIVVFRSGGALYSMPATEVDATATKALNETPADNQELPRRLKVSAAERDRLLRDLEQNHAATGPAEPPAHYSGPPAQEPSIAHFNSDEWNWRERARYHEESIRQAKENLQLLVDRIDNLRAEIRALVALGWKPISFEYQATVLAYTQEAIPAAELAVTRAERLYAQFRDDARRQGVMPGWLR